jgi:hypothetical protein
MAALEDAMARLSVENPTVAAGSRAEAALARLNVENTANLRDIRDALEGVSDEPVTDAFIRRLMKAFEHKKCLVCPFHSNFRGLIKHMRARKHHYGQGRYASEKRYFLRRIQQEVNLFPALTIDPECKDDLTDDERRAFRESSDAALTDDHRAERDELIFIGCLLVRTH